MDPIKIQGPEDIEGKDPHELRQIHKELSFQLRIVNDALKSHVREEKFKKWFEKYPYQIVNGEAVKVNVNEVIDIEQAGFGLNEYGLPEWGPAYGMSEEKYLLLENKEDLDRVLKIQQIFSTTNQVIHSFKKKNIDYDAVHKTLLEGFNT